MSKFRKLLALAIAFVMVLSLAACGGAQSASEAPKEEPAAEESGEMLLYSVTEAEEAEAAPQLEITGPEGTVYRPDVLLWTALEESGGCPPGSPYPLK